MTITTFQLRLVSILLTLLFTLFAVANLLLPSMEPTVAYGMGIIAVLVHAKLVLFRM